MIEKIIRNAWYGEEKLWRVFWLYKILGGTILGFLVEATIITNHNLMLVFSFSIYFVYSIWVLKSLFSCRFNSKERKYLPKVVEIFVFINLFLLLFSTFAILQKLLQ